MQPSFTETINRVAQAEQKEMDRVVAHAQPSSSHGNRVSGSFRGRRGGCYPVHE